jgi:hypothetical protein
MNLRFSAIKLLLLLFLAIPYASSFSQSNLTKEAAKFIPNFSSLSPNSAGIQKYGDYPVNLATGIPEITIPLCTAQDGNLTQDISISYHLGGHTINSFASMVGWGWSLNYGPALNRTINGGIADDRVTNGSYLNNPIIPRDLCNSANDYSFISNVYSGSFDIEPDLFSFTTGSNSGKFMLRKAPLKPFLMPWQAVDIKYITAPNIPVETPGIIEAFEVVNPNGLAYKFGITRNEDGLLDGNGATEYQSTSVNTTVEIIDNGLVSWHIAKIQSPNTTDEIKFQYQTGGTITQGFQSWGAAVDFNQSQFPIKSSIASSLQLKTVLQQNIHKITCTNGEIEFEQSLPSEPRADHAGSNYLKQIKVYNFENGLKTLLKRIVFTYSYFKDRLNTDGRLKLDKLEIFGGSTTIDPLTYTFEYSTNNYSWHLPAGTSTPNPDWNKIDYFGYFNGKNNSHTLDIASYNSISILPGAADRSSVENYMKEATLAKIVYPAGGYTTFETEANRYKNNNVEVIGGGLRIKAIYNYGSAGQLANMKRYKYSSDAGIGVGKLSSNWSFPATGKVGEIKYIGPNGNDIYKTEFLASNGLAEMSSHDATPVYYTSVTEFNEEDGATITNGSIDYTFSYEPDVIVNTPNSLIRDIEPWKRGLLKSKEIKNSAGAVISSLVNEYSLFKEESINNTAKVLYLNHTTGTCKDCSSGMGFGFSTFAGIVANLEKSSTFSTFPCSNPEYDYLTGTNKTGQMKLTQSISTIDGVSTTQTFSYDGNLFPIITNTTDSKVGDYIENETIYPTASIYDNDTDALAMRARNMVGNPLENIVKENVSGVLSTISKQKTVYKSKAGSNARGLSQNLLPTEIHGAPTGGALEKRIEITAFTTNGKPAEIVKDGTPTTLLWGYEGKEIIAEIKNASLSNVNSALATAGINLANYNITTLNTSQLTAINNLANALPNSLVSWQTHIPYVGIGMNLTPNGLKTSFEYDALQRLIGSKDNEGNYTETMTYNVEAANNYTVSRSLRSPVNNLSATDNYLNAIINYQHADGLNRPIQNIGLNQSPTFKSLLNTENTFDIWGRPSESLLPTASTSAGASTISNAKNLAQSFYSDTAPNQNISYEPSPLHRPKTITGAGQAWRTANRKTEIFYENAGSDVRNYSLDASKNIVLNGTYPAVSLNKKRIIDEENHETIEITDRRGRLIQRQIQDDDGFITTHYLYDGLGRIRAVIQPEGYELNQNINYNDANFQKFVFFYNYSPRGLLYEKYMPGGGWTRAVYDLKDRPTLTQTDEQTGRWSYTKYDNLDRETESGETVNTSDRATLQASFNASASYFPNILTYENKIQYLYDSQPATLETPAFGSEYTNYKGLLTQIKARDLATNELYTSSVFYNSKAEVIQVQSQNHLNMGGLPTTTDLELNFAQEPTKIRTRYRKNDQPDIVDQTEISYNHIGLITEVKHGINTMPTLMASYNYDEINRPLKKTIEPGPVTYTTGGALETSTTGDWQANDTWLKGIVPNIFDASTINTGHTLTLKKNETAFSGVLINNGSLVADSSSTLYLSSNNSDIISNQNLSNLQTIDYKYHIRGWLQGINCSINTDEGDLFGYNLTHNYDGKIGANSWTAPKSANNAEKLIQTYTYTYDTANRLKAANYTGLEANAYNIANVGYSKNGKIISLKRNGWLGRSFGLMDNLTFQYTGNKLTQVTDAVAGNHGVDFVPRSAGNYSYHANGSLNADQNENISSIVYDSYLKLPKEINLADGRKITDRYDGAGTLLNTTYSTGETWDFAAGLTYKNSAAYELPTPEGRATFTAGAWKKEYFYIDHLGNTRLSFAKEAGQLLVKSINSTDPFGVPFAAINRETKPFDRNKFQLHESETTFGLNRVNFGFRSYNPTIGLFDGADLLGDINEAFSPMAFVNGDLVNNIDIDGLYASNSFDGKILGDGGGRLPGAPEEEKYQGKPKATIVAAEANYASLRAGMEAFKGALRGLGQLAHDLAPIRIADQNDPKTLGESWQNIKNIPSNLAKLPSQLGDIYRTGDIGQKTQATVQFTGAILGMLKGKASANGLVISSIQTSKKLHPLVIAAQKLYPQKAGKTEWHHPIPKYLGGAKNQRLFPLDAAYHQQITNAFRAEWGYGSLKPNPQQLQKILNNVYNKFPLVK